MNTSVLGANEEYVEQTKAYGCKDAILAFLLYGILILEFLFIGKLFVQKGNTLTETYIFIVTGIMALSSMGLVLLFCKIRNQKLSTIGFSKIEAKKSLKLGLLLLITFAIIQVVFPLLSGSSTKSGVVLITMRVIYYFIFIALMEEMIFRAYIGTRLYGFFSNKFLSIVVVGIMFSLLHIPFQMIMSHMSFLDYFTIQWVNLIKIAMFHFLFQWMYAKYNSIIAPTILHFIWDFGSWFII